MIELRVNFHRQLEAIESKIIHLFALVTEDLEAATHALSLAVAMDMTLVARFYERLGDHAVNIAHRVVYLSGLPAPRPPD